MCFSLGLIYPFPMLRQRERERERTKKERERKREREKEGEEGQKVGKTSISETKRRRTDRHIKETKLTQTKHACTCTKTKDPNMHAARDTHRNANETPPATCAKHAPPRTARKKETENQL